MSPRARRTTGIFVVVFAALLSATLAFARPGGGQSFGGGSRSGGGSSSSRGSGGGGSSSWGGGSSRSGGGSSSGGGGSIGGIVVLIVFIGIALLANKVSQGLKGGGYNVGSAGSTPYVPPTRRREPQVPARTRLRALQAHDPAFSVIVFEDFVSALYTEIVMAAGQGKLDRFESYLTKDGKVSLANRPLQGVSTVLVGAIRIDDVSGLEPASNQVKVEVVFETNLSSRDPRTGHERAAYVVERWTLRRAKSARSRSPDMARVFGCPNCSAPLEQVLAGRCKYCEKEVATGAFDWIVDDVTVESLEERGPMLTGDTAEEGTALPTVTDPRAKSRMDELCVRDRGFSYPGFLTRVTHVFHTFQGAWSTRDLAAMRPFLSDALFATQSYWVSEYKRQHLRNVTENARILNTELARVTSDTYFDAVTLRLYASSLDYTLADDTNRIVSGSRSSERQYSEYWTFVRSREAKGPARVDPQCPRCGAPLAINMAGNCTHCEAKVTSGSFDWVLSRIEQDEVYAG